MTKRATVPRAAALLCSIAAAATGCHRGPPTVADVALTPVVLGVTKVANVGLAGPENVVYDSAADVYLVSNVAGEPAARDDNGFVSRLSAADGKVLELKWIVGGANGATLDAPKGLAIRGDTLAVADVGAVRFFDRRTGAPLGSVTIPGLVMNDLAFASDGTLWVTDTGPDRGTGGAPTDTSKDVDAVWRVMPGGAVKAAARGLALGRPDGIVLDGADALVATFGANRIERIATRGDSGWVGVATLPGGRVDGLRRLPDGALAVTSWDAGTVWRLVPAGTKPETPRPLLTGIASPAGVAVDTRRHQLAVTSMQGNALYLLPLH